MPEKSKGLGNGKQVKVQFKRLISLIQPLCAEVIVVCSDTGITKLFFCINYHCVMSAL